MRISSGLTILFLVCLAGCNCPNDFFDCEKDIPLADVPTEVKAAALKAVPGITLSEAEIEVEKGQTAYELEGTTDGKEYKIEVTADGKVLEVEEDKDDGEDNDENEDDDDDKEDEDDDDK